MTLVVKGNRIMVLILCIRWMPFSFFLQLLSKWKIFEIPFDEPKYPGTMACYREKKILIEVS